MTVFVDGEEIGTTPCSYKGDVGETAHTLSAQAFGETKEFEALKVTSSTDVVFSPAQFGLWLATGQVRDLDGQALEGVKIEAMSDSAPIVSTLTQANGVFELYIPDFASALRFSADGYETITIPISEIPETGMDIRLAKILPTTGSLAITSDPPDAEVWIDGDSLGTTPLSLTNLAPGDYEVILKLDGFENCIKTAVVKIAQTTEVSAELVELPKVIDFFHDGKWTFGGELFTSPITCILTRNGNVLKADSYFINNGEITDDGIVTLQLPQWNLVGIFDKNTLNIIGTATSKSGSTTTSWHAKPV